MAQMSNYLENKLLDLVLRNQAYVAPTTVYLALYSTDPTDSDTGTEIIGGNYARISVAFDAIVNGITQNTLELTFPNATTDWGIVTHIGIRDALTIGNLLFHAPLASSKTVVTDDVLVISPGNLTVKLD